MPACTAERFVRQKALPSSCCIGILYWMLHMLLKKVKAALTRHGQHPPGRCLQPEYEQSAPGQPIAFAPSFCDSVRHSAGGMNAGTLKLPAHPVAQPLPRAGCQHCTTGDAPSAKPSKVWWKTRAAARGRAAAGSCATPSATPISTLCSAMPSSSTCSSLHASYVHRAVH
jgi:hypothetical protein